MNPHRIENLFAPELIDRLQTGGELIAAGARSLDALVAALRHPQMEVRWRAAVALGWLKDPRAVEPLIALMDGAEYEVKVNAAWALGQIGDPRAVSPLLAVMRGEDATDPDVAYTAALALLRCGAQEALRDCLDSPYEYTFRTAHAALAYLHLGGRG